MTGFDAQGNRLAENEAEQCTIALGPVLGDESRRCERVAFPLHRTHLIGGIYHLPSNTDELNDEIRASRDSEPVHWVGDAPTSLHGNGATSFDRTTRDPAEVTCALCRTLLARPEPSDEETNGCSLDSPCDGCRELATEPSASEVEHAAHVRGRTATCPCGWRAVRNTKAGARSAGDAHERNPEPSDSERSA